MTRRGRGDLYANLDADAAFSRLFDFGASHVTTIPLQTERSRTIGIALVTQALVVDRTPLLPPEPPISRCAACGAEHAA